MGLKKKLAMGIATGALAVSMIGGGTYAYFNDVETSTNTFAAGTLDLTLSPTEIFKVENMKPGDWMNRSFTLKNDGNLDIAKVLLKTDYKVTKDGVAASYDLANHIRVNFFWNEDKALLGPLSPDQVVFNTTLAELHSMTPDAVYNEVFIPWFNLEEKSGLEPGDTDKLYVQLQFVDNGQNQNHLQGHELELTWNFEAVQDKGESK